jgi:excisionase family DNA binding protein
VKPSTAAALAATLEQLAAILREEGQDEQPATVERVKLAAASKATGIPASTLRELCARRQITSTKMGRDYMVRLSDIETYLSRKTVTARGSLREASARI